MENKRIKKNKKQKTVPFQGWYFQWYPRVFFFFSLSLPVEIPPTCTSKASFWALESTKIEAKELSTFVSQFTSHQLTEEKIAH